jgi:hypothetical protein
MTPLVYEMDVPSCCGPKDVDFVTFVEATPLIGSRDTVEEFIACGMWPLGQQFCIQVETEESPLSKVIVSMPRIVVTIGQQESKANIVTWIENAVNELVGKYNIAENNAYQGLQYGRLNRIFELAKICSQPHPEPVGRKRKVKSYTTATTPVARKTSGILGRGINATRSVQEFALAKPLKSSMKFAAKSSGLSAVEKASLAGVNAASKKPKCVLDLFGSDSSTSDDEAVPSKRPRKCPRESPVSEQMSKPPPAGGMFD